MRSGLPVELRREIEGLVGALIDAGSPKEADGPGGARLRVERLLGHGALFVTFAATRIDRRGAAPVALKVLRPSIALAWPEGPRVLSREQARLVSFLNERVPPSPHVVRLLDAGELPRDPARGVDLPVPWLTLELVATPVDAPDASLFSRVRLGVTGQGTALDPRTALAILRGVARGLDLVHGHGLLHRGLSPTNVLLAGDVARVSDLAIARPSGLPPGFGVITDTPAHTPESYRAPEQRAPRNDAAFGPAVDVYAFAALARFTLTGRPDQRLAGSKTLHPAFTDPARAQHLGALDAALDAALSVDPERRPPTAESFFATLEGPLSALARGVRVVRPALAPTSTEGWMWTVRHEPKARLAHVSRAVADEEGRAALAGREGVHVFDGRTHRLAPPVPELESVTAVAHHEGTWIVAGRGTEGRGVIAALEAGEVRRLAEPSSAPVCVAFFGGRLATVDGHHRLSLDGRPVAQLERLACAYALSQLDDELAVVVGMATDGAPWLAAVDLATGAVHPQPWPVRALGFVVARETRGGTVIVGCAHGLVVDVRRATGFRVVATPTQLPISDDVSAVAFDRTGAAWVGSRGAVHLRARAGDPFRLAHADGALGEIVALAPVPRACLLHTRDGLVLEGRDLQPPSV